MGGRWGNKRAGGKWCSLLRRLHCGSAGMRFCVGGDAMRKERVLQVFLVLIGLFFVAGIYPLLTSLPQHQQSDYGDQMMLAVYFVLGVFLLLAVRRPASHRILIAFTGWGTLAHDAVMAVQASQLKQLRSELLPLTVVAFLCVALIALSPPK